LYLFRCTVEVKALLRADPPSKKSC
jgi:hypothetical protein